MQDVRINPEQALFPMQRKRKPLPQASSIALSEREQMETEMLSPPLMTQKGTKRSLRNEPSPSFQHSDRSTPDSLPDSRSIDEYRALRRKYLLLEEEHFSVGKELSEIEAEVKMLEEEKHALLDQLVVLEGLVDPTELQPQVGL